MKKRRRRLHPRQVHRASSRPSSINWTTMQPLQRRLFQQRRFAVSNFIEKGKSLFHPIFPPFSFKKKYVLYNVVPVPMIPFPVRIVAASYGEETTKTPYRRKREVIRRGSLAQQLNNASEVTNKSRTGEVKERNANAVADFDLPEIGLVVFGLEDEPPACELLLDSQEKSLQPVISTQTRWPSFTPSLDQLRGRASPPSTSCVAAWSLEFSSCSSSPFSLWFGDNDVNFGIHTGYSKMLWRFSPSDPLSIDGPLRGRVFLSKSMLLAISQCFVFRQLVASEDFFLAQRQFFLFCSTFLMAFFSVMQVTLSNASASPSFPGAAME